LIGRAGSHEREVSSHQYRGHQVQLGRPDVAVRAAEHIGIAALAEGEVVRDHSLVQHVVGVQADVAGLGPEHRGRLPGRQLAQFGHPQLDHEPATRAQVPGGVAEDRHLPVLGQHVGDGVEDQIDQRVLARRGGRGHVAGDHRDGVLVHLGAQLVDHQAGQFDAGDRHATGGQRYADPAGADG
jgi:hypothetical protein